MGKPFALDRGWGIEDDVSGGAGGTVKGGEQQSLGNSGVCATSMSIANRFEYFANRLACFTISSLETDPV